MKYTNITQFHQENKNKLEEQFKEEEKRVERINGNKLIAVFMGYKYYPSDMFTNSSDKKHESGWKNHLEASSFSKLNTYQKHFLCRTHNQLPYHHDWNYLIRVIRKITKEMNIQYDYLDPLKEFDTYKIWKNIVIILEKQNKYTNIFPENYES